VLVFGGRLMVNVTTPRYAPLDVISVPISAIAFGGLVYGLSSFGEPSNAAGQGENTIGLISVAIGVVAMIIFVIRQLVLQKRDRALLDLRTFTSKNFAIAVSMMAISMMALFGVVILLPIYMQNVIDLDTLRTGALLLPGGLVMGLLGPQVGKLYERFGPTMLLVPGAIVVSAVLWAMTLLTPETPWVNILIGHITISIGLAFMFTPLFTVSLSSVRPDLYSHGSATLGSIQQVAGAAGVALFIAIMSTTSARLASEGADAVHALSSGITAAFMIGAILSLFAILAAFFIRRPPDFGGPDGPEGH
jgi:DHA2 family lincomycin resistance protein-like MFS transporter